jgi:site-specific recombinase XerD
VAGMNETGFREFLRKQGRSKSTIESCAGFVNKFEDYLQEHRGIKGIDEATPGDLREFISWGKKERKSINSYLWAIHRYYEFTSDKKMYKAALDLRRHEIENRRGKRKPLNLRMIQGVSSEHVERLKSLGITNVRQMIEAGRTKTQRLELSKKTGIPLQHILDLVKFADITRISDIKGVRGRLLLEAKVDTIEKLSEFTAEDLREKLIEVNEKKKILRRPPTLVETTYWVEQANKLPEIVEY